jgi:hypothetical protein
VVKLIRPSNNQNVLVTEEVLVVEVGRAVVVARTKILLKTSTKLLPRALIRIKIASTFKPLGQNEVII